MEEQNVNPIKHVVSYIKTEYDVNTTTGEISNFVNTVLKSDDIEFEKVSSRRTQSQQPKAQKKPKITIDTIAATYNLAIAYIRTYNIKFTKEAAKILGALSEEGKVYRTPSDKNIRIRTRYVRDAATKAMYPIMEVVDTDENDKLPQMTDSLVVSCNGRDNEMLSMYGMFYILQPTKENPNICVLKSYDTFEELASANNIEIPDGFEIPKDSSYFVKHKNEEKNESEQESNDAESNSESNENNDAPSESDEERIAQTLEDSNLTQKAMSDEELRAIIDDNLPEEGVKVEEGVGKNLKPVDDDI